MRRLVTLAASAALFSIMAYAETFTGRLVDVNCANQDKTAKECDAGSATTSFALIVEGKAMPLDDAGNKQATEALKNRADRSTDPTAPKASSVMAKVDGEKNGDTLKVTSIQVQ
jgi:hypothetical protein